MADDGSRARPHTPGSPGHLRLRGAGTTTSSSSTRVAAVARRHRARPAVRRSRQDGPRPRGPPWGAAPTTATDPCAGGAHHASPRRPGTPGHDHAPPRPPQASRPLTAEQPSPRAHRVVADRCVGRCSSLVVVLAYLLGVPLHAYSEVTRVNAAPAGDRPAPGKGSNYLLLGSDSREGLTAEQLDEMATEQVEGNRTDTIMVLHHSDSGPSSLVSIPRDSYVPIPGHGTQKINAAFAIGGPQLMAATVEQATGLRLDGYLEIGFGGFAGVVDALGGVNICVAQPMDDPMAGINLQPGCQVLSGPTALGYVRARHSDPRGDIGRAERQRQFLQRSSRRSRLRRPSSTR